MQYALFYIDFFVNNIQKNHHLTALNGDFIIVCVTFLIMPFIVAFSISTKIRQLKVKFHDVCQCPLSGFLHFYLAKAGKYLDILVKCQCPLSGFLHFYGIAEGDEFKIICVNALYRAFSISTYYCALRHEEHSNCVNALYRAFSISTM